MQPIAREQSVMEDKEQLSYDVFISYRRKGGAEKAQLVKSEIRLRGIEEERIFLDTHSLHDGDFEQKIKVAICQSENVIVIISNGCFDEVKETDFWYMEIKEALAQGKRVVPVFFDGITSFMNRNVPQELQELTKKNAVTYHHDYADAAFDKLANFIGFRTERNLEKRKGCLFKYNGLLVSVTLAALLCFVLAPMAFFKIYDNLGDGKSYGGSEGYVAVNSTGEKSPEAPSGAVIPDANYPDECGSFRPQQRQQPQNTQKPQEPRPSSDNDAGLREEQIRQMEELRQKREEEFRLKEEQMQKREELQKLKREEDARMKEESARKHGASPTSTYPYNDNPTAHGVACGTIRDYYNYIYTLKVRRISCERDGHSIDPGIPLTDVVCGTGFVLSNGTFVTARQNIQPWIFFRELGGDWRMIMAEYVALGFKVIIEYDAYSTEGTSRKLMFNNQEFLVDTSGDVAVETIDIHKNVRKCIKDNGIDISGSEFKSRTINLYTPRSQCFAILPKRRVSGIPYDAGVSMSTEVQVAGFKNNHDIHNLDGYISYWKSYTLRTDTHNGTIVLQDHNRNPGYLGSPAFIKESDGSYCVIGIMVGQLGGEDRIVPIARCI